MKKKPLIGVRSMMASNKMIHWMIHCGPVIKRNCLIFFKGFHLWANQEDPFDSLGTATSFLKNIELKVNVFPVLFNRVGIVVWPHVNHRPRMKTSQWAASQQFRYLWLQKMIMNSSKIPIIKCRSLYQRLVLMKENRLFKNVWLMCTHIYSKRKMNSNCWCQKCRRMVWRIDTLEIGKPEVTCLIS